MIYFILNSNHVFWLKWRTTRGTYRHSSSKCSFMRPDQIETYKKTNKWKWQFLLSFLEVDYWFQPNTIAWKIIPELILVLLIFKRNSWHQLHVEILPISSAISFRLLSALTIFLLVDWGWQCMWHGYSLDQILNIHWMTFSYHC